MYITKVRIENFKQFEGEFTIELNPRLNILVGDNETGKSTIIEAIYLALTGFYHGKYVKNDINQNLFNASCLNKYLSSLNSSNPEMPPRIRIELYFDNYSGMKGNHNSLLVDCPGLYYEISFNDSYSESLKNALRIGSVSCLPVEYYHVVWRSFRREELLARNIDFKAALIDASTITQNPTDMYVSHILKNRLDEEDKLKITQSYRNAIKDFTECGTINTINDKINDPVDIIGGENIRLSIDLSSQKVWENQLTAYINNIPFHFRGKGIQSIVKTKLALTNRVNTEKCLILIEEPENHLSYSKLNELISDIERLHNEHQILVSTHSSFVLNKLGLESLKLLANYKILSFNNLSNETFAYFKKLAGYDTLRLLLANKTILVEGDSDELVIQKAYYSRHGRLPIQDGINVQSIRGLSFLRFLEIAEALDLYVTIVTDNDGNIDTLKDKYEKYIADKKQNIKICYNTEVYSKDTFFKTEEKCILASNFNYNTLEPNIVKENGLAQCNLIYGKDYSTIDNMLNFLKENKTDAALKLFEYQGEIKYPQYILEAIE